MNIGIDIRPLMEKNRTGVGEYTFSMLDAIFQLDKNNQYYLFYNSAKKNIKLPDWQQDNIHFVKTNYPNKILNLAIILKIICLDNLLPEKIDCWYSPNINFFNLNKKIKKILTIHDLSFEIFPEFYTFKQRLWHWFVKPQQQCQQADLLIVPSENTKRDLSVYYKIDKQKIKVIYPGVADTFKELPSGAQKSVVQKKYNLPENFILFLGSVEPRKNILGLIQAFEKLPDYLTDKYSLIIAGACGWKNRDIYNQALNSKLHNKIKFLGYIPEPEKPPLYSLASVFVFPSFYEGFGFPLLESMKMLCPTITSNRSSLPEITNNAAYLIDPNNTNSLISGIKILLEDNLVRDEYLKRGATLASNYSWDKSAKSLLKNISTLFDDIKNQIT